MLVTNNESLAESARLLRNLAFTTPRFWHEEIGFNYRLSNIQAAIGVAQLNRIEETIQKKRQIATWYTERLQDVPGLQLPVERPQTENVYWMYSVVVNPEFGASRDVLFKNFAKEGIETRTMFCPLNLQPALLKRRAVIETSCPVAERLWRDGMYLPSGINLSESTVDRICSVVKSTVPICT